MSTATDAVTSREAGPNMTPNTREGSGETLRKNLRCSVCSGVLQAGTPISTLAWDQETRRFRHSPPCSAPARAGQETHQGSATKPTASSTASSLHSNESSPPPTERSTPADPGSGEPGPEAGKDWARIGFTIRLAEYESLRAEVALYAVLGETDATFTVRLRESLLIKAQEALAAIGEVREIVRGQVRT